MEAENTITENETPKEKVLNLVPENDPILKTKLPDFVFDGSVDVWELIGNLAHTMQTKGGIGLAANQCGLPYRVFVMNGNPTPTAYFNPRIVDVSQETILLEEGCLSTPSLFVKIKRPKHIKIRYAKPTGEIVTEKLTGLSARIFQHEMDHLDGIRFIDRANRFHRDQAMRKAKLAKK